MADISINRVRRGHYAYFGVAGNIWSLKQVYRRTERYWYKMLSSRIWHGRFTWEAFHKVRERFPLQRPKLRLNYQEFQGYAVL